MCIIALQRKTKQSACHSITLCRFHCNRVHLIWKHKEGKERERERGITNLSGCECWQYSTQKCKYRDSKKHQTNQHKTYAWIKWKTWHQVTLLACYLHTFPLWICMCVVQSRALYQMHFSSSNAKFFLFSMDQMLAGKLQVSLTMGKKISHSIWFDFFFLSMHRAIEIHKKSRSERFAMFFFVCRLQPIKFDYWNYS